MRVRSFFLEFPTGFLIDSVIHSFIFIFIAGGRIFQKLAESRPLSDWCHQRPSGLSRGLSHELTFSRSQSAGVCNLSILKLPEHTHKFDLTSRSPGISLSPYNISYYGCPADSPSRPPQSHIPGPHYRKSKRGEDNNFTKSLRHH
jgi:hypothetical protein